MFDFILNKLPIPEPALQFANSVKDEGHKVLEILYSKALDSGYVPDKVVRMGIRQLLSHRLRLLTCQNSDIENELKNKYIETLKVKPVITQNTKYVKEQLHYEVPSDFFKCCLGKRLKYSACLFDSG